MIAVRVVVVGVVQGVGFRWHTRREARRRGLSGWVRNRADGSVEAHIEGRDRSVDQLVAWLGDGPPTAAVHDLRVTPSVPEDFTEFEIRRSEA